MKPSLLICLLTIIALSCLEPEGENFVNVPHIVESAVFVKLNDYNSGDTIVIDGLTYLSYTVSPDQLIRELSLKLDEQDIYAAYGNFEINPLYFSKGVHRLFFKASITTGSGSLENLITEELITVQREFVVIIENDPPVPSNLWLDSANGTVTLHWNEYERKNFVSYIITKSCANFNDDYYTSGCYTETITDRTKTSWTDHNYVGHLAHYSVELVTTLKSTLEEVDLLWMPKFTTIIDDGYATIHWRKPFFYANLVKIKVYDGIPIEIPVTDTSYVLSNKIMFGFQNQIKIEFISVDEYPYCSWTHYFTAGTTHSYPSVMPTLYNSKAGRYYAYSYPVTVIMDEDLNVLESLDLDYAERSISYNSSYFITLINGKFYYTDPYTLNAELAYDPPEKAAEEAFSVSNNGFLGYYSKNGKYLVVDLATGDTKFTHDGSCSLSPSGKYLSYGGMQIYEYNGSTYVLKGELHDSYHYFLFLDNDNILVSGEGFLKEYDINSLNVIANFDLGFDGYIGDLVQDPISHKVVCMQSSWFFVINPDTKKGYTVGSTFVRLFNNTLFAATGYSVSAIDCSYVEQP